MEIKWMMIMFTVVFGLAFIGLGIDQYVSNISSVKKAEAGLEECPNINSFVERDTIWVKDCKVFLEAYKASEK